jgi:probable F420-dependent oxidoreductase
MEFGVHLPHLGRAIDGPTLKRFAGRIDALGYHSGWVSDHIAWPREITSKYPYSDDGAFPAPAGVPWLDPLGTLLYVAACTEQIRLGTTVLILGYRPPVQTAKLIATLDNLSGGRTILGVGVGWMREEFEVLGMPFDHRGARADEQLEVFEALFTQPEPAYEGKYYRFPAVGFQPRPVQERVPIWVGGGTEAALRRCVRYGDVLHIAFTPLAEIRDLVARTAALATEAGRDPATIGYSVRVYLDFDGTMDPAKSAAGSPERMLETIGVFRDAGISHILLDPVARGGVEGRLEAVERFAAEVMPGAR